MIIKSLNSFDSRFNVRLNGRSSIPNLIELYIAMRSCNVLSNVNCCLLTFHTRRLPLVVSFIGRGNSFPSLRDSAMTDRRALSRRYQSAYLGVYGVLLGIVPHASVYLIVHSHRYRLLASEWDDPCSSLLISWRSVSRTEIDWRASERASVRARERASEF